MSQVTVSTNAILSFVVKEVCPQKISDKNTYIVKVQGIEMNNLTTVDKVKIENGVWKFSVNLCPILPALIPGEPCSNSSGNTLEVEGTANMLVAMSGQYDGFYTLSCSGDVMSTFTKNGINLIDKCEPCLTGYYCKTITNDKVTYERCVCGDKYIIFFYAPKGKWYIKQLLKNGNASNTIYYEQEDCGSPDEVPLTGWKAYVSQVTGTKPCPPCTPKKLSLQPCIPFDDNIANVILVNCGGYDDANGSYYKDTLNNRFVNVRDSNFVIRYVTDNSSHTACWILYDLSTQVYGNPPLEIYKSPSVKTSSTTCGRCLPCCKWEKICDTPGDPPQVTALDYYNLLNPRYNMSYSSSNNGGWVLYNGFTEVGSGNADHHIVVRTNSTTPVSVDGAYCMTCVTPNNPPAFTKIINTITNSIVMEYNGGLSQWEIRDGATILYSVSSANATVPPFDGWTKVAVIDGNLPLVLNSILPSSINWTLL